jgi:hypothetical protein
LKLREKKISIHFFPTQKRKKFFEKRFYEFDEGGLKREKDYPSLSFGVFLG